jgi:hypothetical protein
MLSPLSDVTINALSHRGTHVVANATDEKLKGTIIAGTDEKSVHECFVVFSAPPSKWWNDVRFACGTIQLCTSLQEAETYHRSRGFYTGDIVDLDTIWKLSKAC